MRFTALVMSCPERASTLARTRQRLSECGWDGPLEVVLDDGIGQRPIDRIWRTWRRMIQRAGQLQTRFALLLEDDVVFGRWFCHNLNSWSLLREVAPGRAFYASLYNPGRPIIIRRVAERYLVADPRFVWGAQAIVKTPETARYIDTHWDSASGNPDQRMPAIAARVTSIYYHVPSLVDHESVPTTWGGIEHSARDFDPQWRAS
jgi:hypothetical protein